MAIRIEVLRHNGRWMITQSGPGYSTSDTAREAVAAGIDIARAYHAATGARATVHLWTEGNEALVFDTASDRTL